MEQVQTTKKNYKDLYGNRFFQLLNTANVSFEFRRVKVNGVTVPVLHVDGMNLSTAERINIDWWPYNSATLSDLEKLPQFVSDFIFHIGYAEFDEVDQETGEVTHVKKASQPRIMGYFDTKGNFVKFSGKHPEWDQTLNGGKGGYTDWENEDDLPKEEPKDAPAPADAPAESAEPTE